jgi:hypothetical protein
MTTALTGLFLAAYDPNDVKPGWIAFWLVVGLGVATFLLWRSMNHQLGKIKAPHKSELAARRERDESGTRADSQPDEPDEANVRPEPPGDPTDPDEPGGLDTRR